MLTRRVSTGALAFVCLLALGHSSTRAGEPVITEIALPGQDQRPQAIAEGLDGNFWVTEVLKHQILRVTPDGVTTVFAVPGDNVGVLQGMTRGMDGNMWFTSREENAIRRVTLEGKFTGTFVIPTLAVKPIPQQKGSWPRGITANLDGNLWFAEMAGNKIGRITPKGEFKEYLIPTADAMAYGIVNDLDGKIWFTESGAGKIGRLDPATGELREFPLPNPKSRPRDIALGPDDNLWFSENGSDDIGRITPDGKITEFPLPDGSKPIGITAGDDGNIWFTAFKANKVGRLTMDGKITLYDLKTPDAKPFGMVTAINGDVWFTMQANKVGRIEVNGKQD